MIILRKPEAVVLNKIREGMRPGDISRELGMPIGSVTNAIASLRSLSVIETIGKGKYRILITEYKTMDQERRGSARKPKQAIPITAEQESYIRQNVKTTARSHMARSMNLGKVTLNCMILQLGLGRVDG